MSHFSEAHTYKILKDRYFKAHHPCFKDCKDRCVGCKSTCEKLKDFNYEYMVWLSTDPTALGLKKEMGPIAYVRKVSYELGGK